MAHQLLQLVQAFVTRSDVWRRSSGAIWRSRSGDANHEGVASGVDDLERRSGRGSAATVPQAGTIEVATTSFGLRRSHYVTADGAERQLTPDPKSAEGRRARLEREHPSVSRVIGVASVIMLIVGVGLNLLQIIEPISRIPPIAENVGVFASPIYLPLWLNITLGLGAALASTERALRLRSHWLLDAGGN